MSGQVSEAVSDDFLRGSSRGNATSALFWNRASVECSIHFPAIVAFARGPWYVKATVIIRRF